MVADTLSLTFSALADPTRRAILTRLSRGETSVKELAEPFQMTLPAISKHLKVLERAGLVERGRHAQWRPCRLRAEPLKGASDWIEQYRQLWEERLDRLEAYLAELQSEAAADSPADSLANPFDLESTADHKADTEVPPPSESGPMADSRMQE